MPLYEKRWLSPPQKTEAAPLLRYVMKAVDWSISTGFQLP
jgi:hypothetical protein